MSLRAIVPLFSADADACESLFNQLSRPGDALEARRALAESIVDVYPWSREQKRAAVDYLAGVASDVAA